MCQEQEAPDPQILCDALSSHKSSIYKVPYSLLNVVVFQDNDCTDLVNSHRDHIFHYHLLVLVFYRNVEL